MNYDYQAQRQASLPTEHPLALRLIFSPLSYLFLENYSIMIDDPVFPGTENDLRLYN